jgi:hypothetical protein
MFVASEVRMWVDKVNQSEGCEHSSEESMAGIQHDIS